MSSQLTSRARKLELVSHVKSTIAEKFAGWMDITISKGSVEIKSRPGKVPAFHQALSYDVVYIHCSLGGNAVLKEGTSWVNFQTGNATHLIDPDYIKEFTKTRTPLNIPKFTKEIRDERDKKKKEKT